MYDPVTARFLQEDTYTGNPNDPLSLNLYTYCHNEPLMYSDPTGHKWVRREVSPSHYETIWAEDLTWEQYSNMSSKDQIDFFERYYFDKETEKNLGPARGTQKKGWEQQLEDSILYNINRTLEEKATGLVWGTIYEFPKYIGETCYDVYGDLGKTYNKLKSDFAYLREHPTALFEGAYEIGKDAATKAYNDFKTQVINGDAKSRAKYFTGAVFDVATTVFAFSKAKASIDAIKSTKITKELMDVAKKEEITGIVKGTSELNSLRPVDVLKQGFGESNVPRISSWNLYKELGKSNVGRQTLDLIEQNGINATISYTDVPKGLLGQAYGNQAVAYARNTQSLSQTAQTMIHEVTHVINPGRTKRLEMFARIRQLKHIYGNEKIPTNILREEFETVYKSGLYDDYANLTGERLTNIMGNK